MEMAVKESQRKSALDQIMRRLQWHLVLTAGVALIGMLGLCGGVNGLAWATDQGHRFIRVDGAALAVGFFCMVVMGLLAVALWLYGRCREELVLARLHLDLLLKIEQAHQTERKQLGDRYAQVVGSLSEVSSRLEAIAIKDLTPPEPTTDQTLLSQGANESRA
jgi:hypothetical protein